MVWGRGRQTAAAWVEAELVRRKAAMWSSNCDCTASRDSALEGTELVRRKNLADVSSMVWCPTCRAVQRMQNFASQSAHHMLCSKLPCPGLGQKPLFCCAPGAEGAEITRAHPTGSSTAADIAAAAEGWGETETDNPAAVGSTHRVQQCSVCSCLRVDVIFNSK